MHPPEPRLVERDTPDPEQFVPPPVRPAESGNYPFILNLIEGLIGVLVRWKYDLEHAGRPCADANGQDEVPRIGRGW